MTVEFTEDLSNTTTVTQTDVSASRLAHLEERVRFLEPLADKWRDMEHDFIDHLRDAVNRESVELCEGGIERFCRRIGVEYRPQVITVEYTVIVRAEVPLGDAEEYGDGALGSIHDWAHDEESIEIQTSRVRWETIE